ncbi:stage III sporulation protein D [Anaerosporomusa subterranea]|uniref:Stage III sporulation protein D n=1 Tax=Anaerosporomusa subterranea TaxID=1794912 RepID=A0A154BU22_ANASB|nr:SpoIIIAH-like family protein [Anaerosporomusa subterranea]KYZ77524.1 stage III sporulation protein D [Anaerosporomusa subterranea]
MLVVTLNKVIKRILLGLAVVAILAIVTAQFVNYQKDKEPTQVKVDRSNAMQVIKPIEMALTIPDFFTEYRLERDKIRSERFDVLRDMVKNSKTEDSKQRVQEAILRLVQEKQREYEMENLIKARGFQDALVVIQDKNVNAIIKAQAFTREEVTQVAEVISRVTGVRPEDITISAKP